MLQDIYPKRLNNQYDSKKVAEDESFVLLILGNKVMVSNEGEVSFPRAGEFGDTSVKTKSTYLFCVDNEEYFLHHMSNTDEDNIESPKGYSFIDVKDIREAGRGPKHRIYAMITAKHLADWYRDNRFCGRCGKPMLHSKSERAMTCTECGYTSYPRIMPAVIVGVKNGDNLLLTKYRTGYRHNALVAGFTEIGETVEETVQREVLEETGLHVKNIRYYKSQPWGVANDILMGYYCDVDGDTSIQMDENELRYACWTKREDIILQPDDYSLTNEMMMKFKEGEIR